MNAREAKRRVCAFAARDLSSVDWCAALYDGIDGEDVRRVQAALDALVAELEDRSGWPYSPAAGPRRKA